MIIQLLNTGRDFLDDTFGANNTFQLSKVRIGQNVVTPSPSGTDVTQFVYEAGVSVIKTWSVEDDDLIILSIVLDWNIGDFNVGNFMLFATDVLNGNAQVPILWGSLLNVQPKRKVITNTESGNKIVLTFKMPREHIAETIDVSNLGALALRLPVAATERSLPQENGIQYTQYQVAQHSATGDTFFAYAKDSRQFLGMPFFRPLDDNSFPIVDGGYSGDAYAKFKVALLDGGWYGPVLINPEISADGGTYTGWSQTRSWDGGSYVG